jgi:ribonuclease PH
MTGREKLIEIGATAEKIPLNRKDLDRLIELAAQGIKTIVKTEMNLFGAG